MSELKTRPNKASVEKFLDTIENEKKRKDSYRILELMKDITGEKPTMWGHSIIGFGTYHYKYPSGTEGNWMLTGFSPRKQALTLYIMSGFKKYDDLLSRLGNYKTGKSCLYIKKLEDIDEKVLKKMIKSSVDDIKKRYANK